MQETPRSSKITVFSSTLIEDKDKSHPLKSIPFSLLKQFVTKMNTQQDQQRQIAEQYKQIYREHPEYVVTAKEISDLLPNIRVETNNKALTVFGITYKETIRDKKYFQLTPLAFIDAILMNTCNEVDYEEKIRFAFKMYDDDQDGLLSRRDIWKLLSYQNEENGIGFQDALLDEMVEAIFDELDNDNNGSIDFEEFKEFYSRFKDVSVVISASHKRTASIVNEPKIDDSLEQKNGRCLSLRAQLSIEGTKYLWMFLYLIGLILSGWWYFKTYYGGILARGVAKMFAGMINYNLMLIILMINKTFISFLRVVPLLTRIFPINKNIVFHKHMAVIMIVCTIGHISAHLFGTFILITNTPIDVLNSSVLYSPMTETPSYGQLLFASVPGVTGILLLIGFVLMSVLARKVVKTVNFELFWYSHHIYVVLLVLVNIHGMKEYVAPQTYWKWIIVPALLLGLEKLLKFYKMAVYKYQITELHVSSGVIELELRRPRNFVYTAGQYVMVNIPEISKLQWHPFTISSCPKDTTINFHISPVGWWTKKLAQLAKDYETKKIKALPTVRVDGPWGAPSQHYDDFKHLMIISSGIGATPFCSILREILIRLRRNDQRLKFEEIDFFWVNRKPQNTKWLNKVLLDLRSEYPGLNLYVFYTGAYEKYDFRSFMLWNGFQFMKEKGRLSSEAMANFDCMHWGRPDWDDVFARVARKYAGKKVGVFACANKILCRDIHGMCVKYSDRTNFHFFKENFN